MSLKFDVRIPDIAIRAPPEPTATTGIAALGELDALASCAYGPEAIVIARMVAGAAEIAFTLPVTAEGRQ